MFSVVKQSSKRATLIRFRGFSSTSRVGSAHEEHHEEHGHEHEHGHDHHHGPEPAPEQHLFNPLTRYLFIVSGGLLGAVYLNSIIKAKYDKTLLSFMGDKVSEEIVDIESKKYFDRVSSKQNLFNVLQFKQPRSEFVEISSLHAVPRGSVRNLVPGKYFDPEQLDERRARIKVFKDL